MKRILLVLSFLCSANLLGQETFWTYYDTWCMGADNQWTSLSRPYYISTKTYGANLNKTTHVIVFNGNEIVKSDHSPYYSIDGQYIVNGGATTDSLNVCYNGSGNPQSGQSSWTSRGTIFDLRDSLHAHGGKILMCVQAVNATAFSTVLADSTKTQTLVNSIWGWNVRHGFDGMNLNIENNETFTDAQFVAFFRMLYNAKPAGQLISSVPPATQWTKYVNVVQYHDYIVPQFYAYVSNWQVTATCSGAAGNGVFLKAPLYINGIPAGSNHQDLQTWGPNQWYQNGWAKNKVVVLLSNEANVFHSGDTLFSCAGSSTPFWADTLAYWMLGHGGTDSWSTNIGSYIHGASSDTTFSFQGGSVTTGQPFIIPHLSDRNIDSVIAWSRTNGYSNFGLYDIATDTRTPNTNKNPRHNHFLSQLNIGNATDTIITVVKGDLQTGNVSSPLTDSLKILAVNQSGAPVANLAVAFAVGSVPSGATGTSVSSASVNTNSVGWAAVRATLGNKIGIYTFTATVSDATNSPLTFTATTAQNISIYANNAKLYSVTTSSDTMQVKVTDGSGNGVSGVNVSAVMAATPNFSGGYFIVPASGTTDSRGIFSTIMTLGNIRGQYFVTFTSPGLTGSPLTMYQNGQNPKPLLLVR